MTPITIVPFLKKVDAVIINPILEVVFSIALLYFVYAVIKLISSDGKGRAEARSAVLWSIVGMFVMISVYGIINLVLSTFEIPSGNNTAIIKTQLGR